MGHGSMTMGVCLPGFRICPVIPAARSGPHVGEANAQAREQKRHASTDLPFILRRKVRPQCSHVRSGSTHAARRQSMH